jgi:glycosyltransferase involved in cell wall biosynthesis
VCRHTSKRTALTMTDWRECCTIGITSRDRAEDLRHTIAKQLEIGLGAMRYIIVDDGSADASAVRRAADGLPHCRLLRHESTAGYVQRRQEMAEMCETEFLISLDDDSYFVETAGMEERVAMIEKDPRLALLSFCVVQLKPHERRRTQFPAGELWWFRGCGYLLRVSSFIEVGGYPPQFYYGGEETHLARQFFRAGYKMVHCPEVRVEHRWSGSARVRKQMEYGFTRGQVLVKMLNEPYPVAVAGAAFLIFRRFLNDRKYFLSHLQGWLSGVRAGMLARRRYKHLTWRQYRVFRASSLATLVPERVEHIAC